MKIDLAHLARDRGVRRKTVRLPRIIPTSVLENDLLAIYSETNAVWQALTNEIDLVYREPLAMDAETDEEADDEPEWWEGIDWLTILALIALFASMAKRRVSGQAPVEIPDALRPVIDGNPRLSEMMTQVYANSLRPWVVSVPTPGILSPPKPRQETYIYQTEKLGRWVTRVGTWHGAKTIAGVKSALGVDIAPYIRLSDVAGLLDASIQANVALIGSVNSDNQSRIEAIVRDAFTNRRTKKWLTDALAEAMGITKRRARLIANDQMYKLGIALTAYRNQQMGIETYIWHHTPQTEPRPTHVARDLKVFRWSTPPPDGHPGYAIACKCYPEPVVDIY